MKRAKPDVAQRETSAPTAAPATATPTKSSAPTAASSATTLTVRVEEGRDVVTADGWELSIWHDLGDGEPRIRDVDAAVRLGFKQPRNIRQFIKRLWPEGGPTFRTTVMRNGPGRRPAGEWWLTEAELLKLCARSETPIAEAVLDDMIRVYLAVRRGLLVRTLPMPPLETREVPPSPPPARALSEVEEVQAGMEMLLAIGRGEPVPARPTASTPAPVPPRPTDPAGYILWDALHGPKPPAPTSPVRVINGEFVTVRMLLPAEVVTALLAYAQWDAQEFADLAEMAAAEGFWRFVEEVSGKRIARADHRDTVRAVAATYFLCRQSVERGEARLASDVRREVLSPKPTR